MGALNAPPEALLSIGDATVIARNGIVPASPAGRGLVLLSIEQGRYVELDEVGRAIWERIGSPRAFGELVDGLAEQYDAPRETIASDVRAWLDRLRRAGVVALT